MAKYKVGDKVKIRKDLKGGCCYNGLYFADNMEEYRGKIATITEIDDGGCYLINLDKRRIWSWNDDMIENKILTEKQFNDKINELEQQIAELKEQLEKKDNKMSVGEIWKPKKDERYYFNRHDGTTGTYCNGLVPMDIELMQLGNCYPTKEKAEFEAQREKYTRLFRQYVEQHSEPLDWDNQDQKKWSVYYDCEDKKLRYSCCCISKDLFSIHSSSEQVLQEAIDFVGEDNVKKYILEIGE